MKLSVIILGLIMATSAFGAVKPGECHLKLVVSNDKPQVSTASSSESEMYLAFLADMKLFGISFKNPSDPVWVESAFKAISNENLSRMLHAFDEYLKHTSGESARISSKAGYDFVYWKNLVSPQTGVRKTRLLSDKKILETYSKQREPSLWSKILGGFHGVPLNMEYTTLTPEELSQRVLANGTAKVTLKNGESLKWAYALPFVGSEDTDYVGLDNRFFAFLGVYSPGLFGHFFSKFSFFFPDNMNMKDVSTGRLTGFLDAFLKYEGSEKLLMQWTPLFKHLILNHEDAQYFVAYMAGQKPGLNFLDSTLTVMIPGEIGADDYLLNDNPLKPSTPPSNGPNRSGPIVSFGKPNMTGDVGPFPKGPDTN